MRLPFIPCQRQRKEKYDKSTSASIHTNTALRLPAKPPKRTPAVSFSSPPPAAHLLFLLARQRKRRWGAETVCAHLGVKQKKKTTKLFSLIIHGAGDEARTRYLHLGKVALYQMSYARRYKRLAAVFEKEHDQAFRLDRVWSGRRGSNSLPPPWQGGALPDELRPQNSIDYMHSRTICQYRFLKIIQFF